MQPQSLFRHAAQIAACALTVSMLAAPAGAASKPERGVASIHQPMVERTDFVFDVAAGPGGTLDPIEARRLAAWFRALDLRYGDHVTFTGLDDMSLAGLHSSVREIIARHGVLAQGEAPITAGTPPVGSMRIVLSRSVANVPGCPSWNDRKQTDFAGGLSDNFGCATAGNLAAMIADPQDLVSGRSSDSDLRTATSNRAIKSYQDKEPTGAGGLQVMAAGGE